MGQIEELHRLDLAHWVTSGPGNLQAWLTGAVACCRIQGSGTLVDMATGSRGMSEGYVAQPSVALWSPGLLLLVLLLLWGLLLLWWPPLPQVPDLAWGPSVFAPGLNDWVAPYPDLHQAQIQMCTYTPSHVHKGTDTHIPWHRVHWKKHRDLLHYLQLMVTCPSTFWSSSAVKQIPMLARVESRLLTSTFSP